MIGQSIWLRLAQSLALTASVLWKPNNRTSCVRTLRRWPAGWPTPAVCRPKRGRSVAAGCPATRRTGRPGCAARFAGGCRRPEFGPVAASFGQGVERTGISLATDARAAAVGLDRGETRRGCLSRAKSDARSAARIDARPESIEFHESDAACLFDRQYMPAVRWAARSVPRRAGGGGAGREPGCRLRFCRRGERPPRIARLRGRRGTDLLVAGGGVATIVDQPPHRTSCKRSHRRSIRPAATARSAW